MTNPVQKININSKPARLSIEDLMTEQESEMGLEPRPLEVPLLLKRINNGGYSGQFLADAFISMYRSDIFPHSLAGLRKLDAEGFRLFHEILHVRYISGWNDDFLYKIEQEIKKILEAQS